MLGGIIIPKQKTTPVKAVKGQSKKGIKAIEMEKKQPVKKEEYTDRKEVVAEFTPKTPEEELFGWMEEKGLIVLTDERAVLTRLGKKFSQLIMSGRVALDRKRIK